MLCIPSSFFFFFLVVIFVLSGRAGQADQRIENMVPASLTLPPQSHMDTAADMQQQLNDHNSPISKIENDPQVLQRPHDDHFGQIIDVNLSPWTHLYPTGW